MCWKSKLRVAVLFGLVGTLQADAQGPQGAPDSPESDKAKAYYHYSLSHILQERGRLFRRVELLNEAIEELKLALQYDPTSTFLSTELADLYASTGRWENALQEAEAAIQRQPDDLVARRLLGRLYMRVLSGEGQLPQNLQERALLQFEEIVARDPEDVSSYLVLAHLYRSAGERVKAEEVLKKALEAKPDSEDASADLALLYLDIGDYPAAISLLEQVRRRDSDVRVLSALAYAYEQTRDYGSAAAVYSQLLERDPGNLMVRKSLGQTLLFSRQYDQAKEQFESLAEDNPRDAEVFLRLSQIYRMERNFEQARQTLNKAAELAPDDLDVQYNGIMLAEAEGDTQQAIGLTRRILDTTVKAEVRLYSPQERTNRGIFLEKLGFLYREDADLEKAEETFRQMLELGGENAVRGEVRLIETYQEQRDYERALTASDEALRRYPESREVAIARASLLASLGDAEEAVSLLQPLLRGAPEDRETWLAIAQVNLRAKQFEKAREAVAEAEKLTEGETERAYIHFLRGSIWEREKQYDRAESEFHKALELNPESAVTLNYLGYMLADQDIRVEEAVGYIAKALEMDPNNGAYLDSLGWAYYRLDKLDLAEVYLKKAAERIPNDPTIRDHLGDVYYKTGRLEEALEEWSIALAEWQRLPEHEVDSDEVSKIEKKLKDGNVKLAQESNEPRR